MTVRTFGRLALVLGFAVATASVPAISVAQNARLGSESGLDRAMQENLVKDRGFGLKKGEKIDKAEEAAYKAFLAAQNGTPATRIQLGESFAAKFPTSRYLPVIYGILTTSYFATGDTDKMFTAGSRALQLDPQNVDVMADLAVAIPRRVKPDGPDAAERLQAAEVYAHRAIDIIPTLTKPPKTDDASFEKAKNNKLALAYSGLGLLDIDRQKYDDARAELSQATLLASRPDPVDYFLLGNADTRGNHYDEAVAAYEKCSASGPMVDQCKAGAESARREAGTLNLASPDAARAKADSWYPVDVDEDVPEVASGTTCPLNDVLS
ncbi:MAG TPA: tetratricopeptide repeat protein, partial [Pirellulales bacterium]|nr:tetratricopeptide repeat protein [Pirellulales bacterium]